MINNEGGKNQTIKQFMALTSTYINFYSVIAISAAMDEHFDIKFEMWNRLLFKKKSELVIGAMTGKGYFSISP